MRYKIFICSVQKEFAKERRMLSDYLRRDALFGKFFDVFIFENMPDKDQISEKDYVKEVQQSNIYLEYGLPDPEFKMRDGFVAIIYRKKGLAEASVGRIVSRNA